MIHQAFCAGVKDLLFLGSSCIYPRECPQPIQEGYLMTGPLEPTNAPYALAKISGIELCRAYNRQYGVHYRCVMPTNLYGENDNFDLQTSHVLPAMIRKFHLARLAQCGDWNAVERDQARFGMIPKNFILLAAIAASRLSRAGGIGILDQRGQARGYALGKRDSPARISSCGRSGRGCLCSGHDRQRRSYTVFYF